MKQLFLIGMVLYMALQSTCLRRTGATEIRYEETVDVFENGSHAHPDPGTPILGFSFGYDLPAEVIRFARDSVMGLTLPAAGAEIGACQDGEVFRRAVYRKVINSFGLIGDTGNEDVSDDRDCHCDSRIEYIHLDNFTVYFDGPYEAQQLIDFRIENLCPNIPDGHHYSGDREFGGKVYANMWITLRVLPDNSSIVADVKLHMHEIDI
jgi:hypothetical protein